MPDSILAWAAQAGIRIVISILVLIIGFKLINMLCRKLSGCSSLEKMDKTVSRTLIYAAGIIAKCIIVICLIGYLGIDTSGIAALVASLGVAAGLALNGALGNVAGGVLILITRPFKVDDFIEVAGYTGTVEDIRLVYTRIVTLDNKVVSIPNGTASSATVVNYSEKDLRRVDLEFAVSYQGDYRKAEALLTEVASAHPLVLDEPAPTIRVAAHSASSMTLCFRVWTKNADYWDVYFDMLEQAKTKFDENGIEIPYEQLDVHVKNS